MAEVGLLETRTGGSDKKGGTPDRYWREVSLLEQHKELQEIVEERKEGVVEKQGKEEEKILASVAQATALMGVS